MERFLEEAERNGIRILGEIAGLALCGLDNRSRKSFEIHGRMGERNFHPLQLQGQATRLPRKRLSRGKGIRWARPDWLGVPVDRDHWGRGIKVAVIDSGIDVSHPPRRSSNIGTVSIAEAQLPGPRYGSGFNNRREFAKPKDCPRGVDSIGQSPQ